MNIEVGYWRTRDGTKVEIGWVYHKWIIGVRFDDPREFALPLYWDHDGKAKGYGDMGLDLIAPWTEPKSVKQDVWIWLWNNGVVDCREAPPPPECQRGDKSEYKIIGAKRLTGTVTEGIWE